MYSLIIKLLDTIRFECYSNDIFDIFGRLQKQLKVEWVRLVVPDFISATSSGPTRFTLNWF